MGKSNYDKKIVKFLFTSLFLKKFLRCKESFDVHLRVKWMVEAFHEKQQELRVERGARRSQEEGRGGRGEGPGSAPGNLFMRLDLPRSQKLLQSKLLQHEHCACLHQASFYFLWFDQWEA